MTQNSVLMEMLGPYVPRIEDYFGLWVIQPEVAEAIEGRFNQLDKLAHVREQRMIGRSSSDEDDGMARIEDGVGIINIQGVLQKRSSSLYETGSTVSIRQKVRQFAEDDSVRGIALLIESPGGQASGVPELAAEIQRAGAIKPVRAYIEDLGASGAYWIASAARDVTANAGAMVGSIGVFTVVQDTSRQAEQMGIKVHVVKAGAMKAAGTWGVEISEDYLNHLQTELIEPTYQQFTRAVATGRRMSAEDVLSVASGKVWHASKARELKLIDAVDSFDSFLESFKREVRMTTTESAAPIVKAATIGELKAKFPESSSDWRESQIEAEATLEQAAIAYGRCQDEKVRELQKKVAAAEAASVATQQETVDTLAGTNGAASVRLSVAESSAKKQFADLIDAKVSAGMKRPTAYNQVCVENPALLQSTIEEANKPKA